MGSWGGRRDYEWQGGVGHRREVTGVNWRLSLNPRDSIVQTLYTPTYTGIYLYIYIYI